LESGGCGPGAVSGGGLGGYDKVVAPVPQAAKSKISVGETRDR